MNNINMEVVWSLAMVNQSYVHWWFSVAKAPLQSLMSVHLSVCLSICQAVSQSPKPWTTWTTWTSFILHHTSYSLHSFPWSTILKHNCMIVFLMSVAGKWHFFLFMFRLTEMTQCSMVHGHLITDDARHHWPLICLKL